MPSGQFNETKKSLMDAIEVIAPECMVTGNWRVGIKELARHLPFVSVRFTDERVWGPYDTPDTSEMEGSYRFSIHIFHSNCAIDTGHEKGWNAQYLADRIKSGLYPNPPVVGWDVELFSCRESEPSRGARRVSRVIIKGAIHIQRVD